MPTETSALKEQELHPSPRPPGEPQAATRVREMIEATLAGMIDRYVIDDFGSYVFGFDSARVFVVPTWVEEGPCVIRVFAITNMDVPLSGALTSYLLEKNLEFVFGGFALDAPRGAVWFNHNLLGEFTTPEAFEATVAAVAETANEYDDIICNRFGGRLYTDETSRSVPTPATPGYL
ncbi:MAG TPA: YbjN domain-containing protein [Actinomycetota bacterium]|nr:YbjN domain-containing protein [Actinomycetota bacterium]